MRLSQLTFSGVALLAASVSAQQSDFDARPMLRTGAAPAPIASQLPPAPVNGSDLCATADALGSATGAIPYDLTLATTGPEGQTSFTGGYCNYGCAEYGNGQVAVLTDVWFSWTAPATGRMRITTCPNQNDTKIALYPGPTCPTGTATLGCNDDFHFNGGVTAGLLDSILYYNVTAGEQLLIQVGQSSFNTALPGFTGTFNIDLDPAHETGAVPLDDGFTDVNFSFGVAATTGVLGLNRYANTGDVTTLTGVSVCWGWAGSAGWVNGTPAYVGLWNDSISNDGDPTDAVLVEQVATTIQSGGTDTFVTIPFATNHTMNGMYFIGYGSQRVAATEFPLTGDLTVCNIQPDTAWRVINLAAPVNLVNLGANTTLPGRLEATCQAQGAFNGLYHSAFAVRPNILVGPPPVGAGECFGDGTGAACPCVNNGAAGRGCANSTNAAGARLTAVGVASVSADSVVLTCDGMTGPGLFFQSNGLLGPINFNDGLLCAGVGILRLGVVFPTAGNAIYPGGLTPNPLTVGGAPILAGNVKHYQCWYRDITVGFCVVAGHNMSSGLGITWVP